MASQIIDIGYPAPRIRPHRKWEDLEFCAQALMVHGLIQEDQAAAIVKALKKAKKEKRP